MSEQDTGRQGGGRTAGTVLLVFLVIYFLFPVVFIWPFIAVYGVHSPPPQPVAKFFKIFLWPDEYLYNHVSVYHDWIETESKWVGLR